MKEITVNRSMENKAIIEVSNITEFDYWLLLNVDNYPKFLRPVSLGTLVIALLAFYYIPKNIP